MTTTATSGSRRVIWVMDGGHYGYPDTRAASATGGEDTPGPDPQARRHRQWEPAAA